LMVKSKGIGTPLLKAMLNSIMISFPATFFTVYFSSMTAYGVYVYNFKLRRLAWSFILGIMMIPMQVSIIGFYKFMIQVGLNDSYIPLIIPAVAAPSTVFFMRQYMKTALPLEIIDAARIDGSGEFYTFNTIAAPLMKPAMATQAIFAFIASWNNLYTPSIILSSSTKYTLPMFVQVLRSEQFRSDYGVIYVGLLLTVLPLFVVYFALSKYIIAGVALGGVKE
jgi:multiple sugar transport system permease protein